MVQYIELGDKIEDGLLAWISFGINTTLSQNVSVTGTLTKDGGMPGHDLDVPEDEEDWHTKPRPPGWRTIMKKDVIMEDAQVTPIYLPPKSIGKKDEDAQLTRSYLPPIDLWKKDENAHLTRPYLPPKSIWKEAETWPGADWRTVMEKPQATEPAGAKTIAADAPRVTKPPGEKRDRS